MSSMTWLEEVKKPVPILLVEDSEADRTIIRRFSKDFHRELIEVRDGHEALEILGSRPDIKLVILDETLPGMSGIDVFRQMRERKLMVPVVFLTGYGGTLTDKVSKVGFAAVVGKPVMETEKFIIDLMTTYGIPKK